MIVSRNRASRVIPAQAAAREPLIVHRFGCLEVRETAVNDPVSDAPETLVHLIGELDMDAAPRLRELLAAALQRTGTVRVNAAEVSFIDSTGIHALLASQRRATQLDATFLLEYPSERVRDVLRLTRLDSWFNL